MAWHGSRFDSCSEILEIADGLVKRIFVRVQTTLLEIIVHKDRAAIIPPEKGGKKNIFVTDIEITEPTRAELSKADETDSHKRLETVDTQDLHSQGRDNVKVGEQYAKKPSSNPVTPPQLQHMSYTRLRSMYTAKHCIELTSVENRWFQYASHWTRAVPRRFACPLQQRQTDFQITSVSLQISAKVAWPKPRIEPVSGSYVNYDYDQ